MAKAQKCEVMKNIDLIQWSLNENCLCLQVLHGKPIKDDTQLDGLVNLLKTPAPKKPSSTIPALQEVHSDYPASEASPDLKRQPPTGAARNALTTPTNTTKTSIKTRTPKVATPELQSEINTSTPSKSGLLSSPKKSAVVEKAILSPKQMEEVPSVETPVAAIGNKRLNRVAGGSGGGGTPKTSPRRNAKKAKTSVRKSLPAGLALESLGGSGSGSSSSSTTKSGSASKRKSLAGLPLEATLAKTPKNKLLSRVKGEK